MSSEKQLLTHEDITQRLTKHNDFRESQGASGKHLDLSHCIIENFCFDELDLSEVAAQGALFKNCSFQKVNWSGGNFDATIAEGCNFNDGTFVKAEFFEAKLAQATFVGANLNRAEFIECDLSAVSFRKAQMRGAIISESQLAGADFEGAARETASFADNQDQ
jgi:uncharacterized protein YjbI with pentapeptide repeats